MRAVAERDEWMGKCKEMTAQKQAVEYFRKEAMKFRETVKTLETNTGGLAAQNAELHRLLDMAEQELASVEVLVNARLARLRWRNAAATLRTWGRTSTVQVRQ